MHTEEPVYLVCTLARQSGFSADVVVERSAEELNRLMIVSGLNTRIPLSFAELWSHSTVNNTIALLQNTC